MTTHWTFSHCNTETCCNFIDTSCMDPPLPMMRHGGHWWWFCSDDCHEHHFQRMMRVVRKRLHRKVCDSLEPVLTRHLSDVFGPTIARTKITDPTLHDHTMDTYRAIRKHLTRDVRRAVDSVFH